MNSIVFISGKHLSITTECDDSEVDERIGQITLFCQNYEEERKQLIQNLNRIKVKLNLIDLFRHNSNGKIDLLFLYLKLTHVCNRMEFLSDILVHSPY